MTYAPRIAIVMRVGAEPELVRDFRPTTEVLHELVGDDLINTYSPQPDVLVELEQRFGVTFSRETSPEGRVLRVIVADSGYALGYTPNELATRLYGVPGYSIPGNAVLVEIE